MPQTKRTNDELYKELVDILESDPTPPPALRGDNIELDEDDERILLEIYGAAEESTSEGAASESSS